MKWNVFYITNSWLQPTLCMHVVQRRSFVVKVYVDIPAIFDCHHGTSWQPNLKRCIRTIYYPVLTANVLSCLWQPHIPHMTTKHLVGQPLCFRVNKTCQVTLDISQSPIDFQWGSQIFLGAPLKVNGALGNIQGNLQEIKFLKAKYLYEINTSQISIISLTSYLRPSLNLCRLVPGCRSPLRKNFTLSVPLGKGELGGPQESIRMMSSPDRMAAAQLQATLPQRRMKDLTS